VQLLEVQQLSSSAWVAMQLEEVGAVESRPAVRELDRRQNPAVALALGQVAAMEPEAHRRSQTPSFHAVAWRGNGDRRR
jgi:hypothetical protein